MTMRMTLILLAAALALMAFHTGASALPDEKTAASVERVDEINKLPADTTDLAIWERANDDVVKALKRLTKLKRLSVEADGGSLTDAGVASVAQLSSLEDFALLNAADI